MSTRIVPIRRAIETTFPAGEDRSGHPRDETAGRPGCGAWRRVALQFDSSGPGQDGRAFGRRVASPRGRRGEGEPENQTRAGGGPLTTGRRAVRDDPLAHPPV